MVALAGSLVQSCTALPPVVGHQEILSPPVDPVPAEEVSPPLADAPPSDSPPLVESPPPAEEPPAPADGPPTPSPRPNPLPSPPATPHWQPKVQSQECRDVVKEFSGKGRYILVKSSAALQVRA